LIEILRDAKELEQVQFDVELAKFCVILSV